MAGNLPVPQGLELRLIWQLSGQDSAVNILHFVHAVGTTHTQGRADTIATNVRTAFSSSGLNTFIHPTVSLARVESRQMDANSDPWFIGAGTAVVGTGTGDMLPPSTCFCVTLRTGLRGRSYNGRFYQWGYTEASNDTGGNCLAAAADATVGFIGAISSGLGGALALQMGVLSRWTTLPTAPPNTPATERNPPIISLLSAAVRRDLRWDVQRRRSLPGI